mgnify:CR=1 FL=1
METLVNSHLIGLPSPSNPVEDIVSELLNHPLGAIPEEVHHPEHYQGKTMEALDIIEDFDLNFNLGNVVKYVLRAGKKKDADYQQDLRKAMEYLEREIGRN